MVKVTNFWPSLLVIVLASVNKEVSGSTLCADLFSNQGEKYSMPDGAKFEDMEKFHTSLDRVWNYTTSFDLNNGCKIAICNKAHFQGNCKEFSQSLDKLPEGFDNILSAECSCQNNENKGPVGRGMCRNNFEGFGVHLGAIEHFNKSTDAVINRVANLMYHDLGLRLFRTSYEEFFSPSPNMYDISCRNSFSCTWNKMHEVMSQFPDVKIFASIWSPPHYMKTSTMQLKSEYEDAYYYFVKNITVLIKNKFNQTIELVSLVNEPEYFLAPWDHTNMTPWQLCEMVERFNDPLVSACTENAWYSTTKLYMGYNMGSVNCDRACKIILTHSYALNWNSFSPNFLLAYYDSTEHEETYSGRPVWQTEVSSTYGGAEVNQMLEAMDMAVNIIQFVGTTCVTRYYFWSAFNIQPSGEALIWGNKTTQELTFPKKYYVYRHFTNAALLNPNTPVRRCDHLISHGLCLQFGDGNSPAVFLNRHETLPVALKANCSDLCCTNDAGDYFCGNENVVPAYSVCSCNSVQPHVDKEVEHVPLSTTSTFYGQFVESFPKAVLVLHRPPESYYYYKI